MSKSNKDEDKNKEDSPIQNEKDDKVETSLEEKLKVAEEKNYLER